MDVIGETAFGYKFNSINGGHSKEARATDTILRGQFDMKRRSLEMVFPFFKLIPSEEKAKVDEAKTILNETVLKVKLCSQKNAMLYTGGRGGGAC